MKTHIFHVLTNAPVIIFFSDFIYFLATEGAAIQNTVSVQSQLPRLNYIGQINFLILLLYWKERGTIQCCFCFTFQ